MRVLRRLGLILLVAALAGMGAAPAAWAGGPTSVLITDPAKHRNETAYVTDARYRELAAAIGYDTALGAEVPTTGESPPSGFGAIFRADLRITWLAHDVRIWRIDLIFFLRDSVWIATSRAWVAEPDQAVWHRAADPNRLRAVLAEAQVLPDTAAESRWSAAPLPAAEPVTGGVVPSDNLPTGLLGLGAGLLGIAVGVAAARLGWRSTAVRGLIGRGDP